LITLDCNTTSQCRVYLFYCSSVTRKAQTLLLQHIILVPDVIHCKILPVVGLLSGKLAITKNHGEIILSKKEGVISPTMTGLSCRVLL